MKLYIKRYIIIKVILYKLMNIIIIFLKFLFKIKDEKYFIQMIIKLKKDRTFCLLFFKIKL